MARMTAYVMSRNTEKPISDDPKLQRARESQRKSRARKRDYVRDLQLRVEVCELGGIQVAHDVQQEAKKIARENVRLRELAKRLGISAHEITAAVSAAEGEGGAVPPAPIQPLYGPSQAYLDLMAALEPRTAIIPLWPVEQPSVTVPSPTTYLPSPELRPLGLPDSVVQPEGPEADNPYDGASLFIDNDYAHPDISAQVPAAFSQIPMPGIGNHPYVEPGILMPRIDNQHAEPAATMPYLQGYGQPSPSFPMAPIGLGPYPAPETLLPPVQVAQAVHPQQHVGFQMMPVAQPQESPNRLTWDMTVLQQYPPHL
ncbi:hypothetical protein B0J13DRAFT_183365 [Dactylonectria estremocensis]|uniref:BZIP domain-containing protein n=1 Tax=Dactylonectria estremocensis TaxID=1079267 RepID=A0A9P9FC70_9HYPO|nr:hypothetical protein B0J13DRAFT_183365 [Dactylonectria estremocensis]